MVHVYLVRKANLDSNGNRLVLVENLSTGVKKKYQSASHTQSEYLNLLVRFYTDKITGIYYDHIEVIEPVLNGWLFSAEYEG